MRCARASAPPSFAGAVKRFRVGKVFGGNETFKRGKPVLIVGLARVGIAASLRFFNFIAERGGPLGAGKHSALLERLRKREGLRLPRLAKHRAIAAHCYAASRYGSNASIEMLSVGSAASPHNSRLSNTTV